MIKHFFHTQSAPTTPRARGQVNFDKESKLQYVQFDAFCKTAPQNLKTLTQRVVI